MENESDVNAASGGPEKKSVFVRSSACSEHLSKCVQGKDLMYFQGTATAQTWPFARLPTMTTGSHLAGLEIENNVKHKGFGHVENTQRTN